MYYTDFCWTHPLSIRLINCCLFRGISAIIVTFWHFQCLSSCMDLFADVHILLPYLLSDSTSWPSWHDCFEQSFIWFLACQSLRLGRASPQQKNSRSWSFNRSEPIFSWNFLGPAPCIFSYFVGTFIIWHIYYWYSKTRSIFNLLYLERILCWMERFLFHWLLSWNEQKQCLIS